MIRLCRLDDRLIHGQIVTKWSRVVPVDRIIVANDKAGSNPIIAKSLMMAAPQHIKVAVKTVQDAVRLLQNPKANDHTIMIIVGNPQDLLTIAENVEGIEKANIGNWGLLEDGAEQREKISTFVALSPEEKEILLNVCDKIEDFVFQVTPDMPAMNVRKTLMK